MDPYNGDRKISFNKAKDTFTKLKEFCKKAYEKNLMTKICLLTMIIILQV